MELTLPPLQQLEAAGSFVGNNGNSNNSMVVDHRNGVFYPTQMVFVAIKHGVFHVSPHRFKYVYHFLLYLEGL